MSDVQRRLLLTLGLVLAYLLVGLIPVPELQAGSLGDLYQEGQSWSLGTLGVQPFVSAALLIEFALLVWWRERRQDAALRRQVGRWVLGLGLVFAALQALAVAAALSVMDGAFVVVGGMLLGGSVLAWIVAGLIRRHGLGEGFAWLALAQVLLFLLGGLWRAVRAVAEGIVVPGTLLLVVGLTGAAIWGTSELFRRLGDPGPGLPFRSPVSGIWPWSLGLTATSWAGVYTVTDDTVAVVVAAAVALLWTPVAATIWHWRRRHELRTQHRRAWHRVLAFTAVLMAGLAALDTWLLQSWALLGFGGLVSVALGTALALDLRAEWRARAQGLVLLERA